MDFGAVFDQLPTPYMILDRDFRYAAMNAAYLRVTGRSRDSILGRHVFEAFPAEGESRRLLEESLTRARDTGRPDAIPYLHYSIPRGDEVGGGFEDRYWSVTHAPILDDGGAVRFIVQHTQDVTQFRRLKDLAETAPLGAASLGADMLERAETVQTQNERLRRLMMQAPGFTAVLRGADHTFEFVNNAYLKLIGGRDVIGKPIAEALPEVVNQGFDALLSQVQRTAEAFVGREVEVHLQRGPDGALERRFLDFVYQPIIEADGRVSGVFVQGADVTERIEAEAQQHLLIDELNHRVKNTLATVQAIALQTLRADASPASFVTGFQARISALAGAHDMLTKAQWTGVDLEPLLALELAPYGGDRARLSGPPVRLRPRTGLALGLVFHEMATNAAKYGALSDPRGHVQVRWRPVRDGAGQTMRIEWLERGGPAAQAPSRRGFGSRLIQRSIEGELQGRVDMDYGPNGLACTIHLPLTETTQ